VRLKSPKYRRLSVNRRCVEWGNRAVRWPNEQHDFRASQDDGLDSVCGKAANHGSESLARFGLHFTPNELSDGPPPSFATYRRFRRGSNASRRPSPTKLKLATVSAIITPGKIDNHGARPR